MPKRKVGAKSRKTPKQIAASRRNLAKARKAAASRSFAAANYGKGNQFVANAAGAKAAGIDRILKGKTKPKGKKAMQKIYGKTKAVRPSINGRNKLT